MRPLAALSLAATVSCAPSPLSVLAGGGPKVAANVQAGAENSQTIGQSRSVDQIARPVARSRSIGRLEQTSRQSNDTVTLQCERVERLEQVVYEGDSAWLVWAGFVLMFAGTVGWLAPQPRFVRRWFRESSA